MLKFEDIWGMHPTSRGFSTNSQVIICCIVDFFFLLHYSHLVSTLHNHLDSLVSGLSEKWMKLPLPFISLWLGCIIYCDMFFYWSNKQFQRNTLNWIKAAETQSKTETKLKVKPISESFFIVEKKERKQSNVDTSLIWSQRGGFDKTTNRAKSEKNTLSGWQKIL